MVLARNTYRFALLLVGYAIASGLDDIGAYDAGGIALLGLGLGGFALFAGTLAHYVPEGPDGGARVDGTGGGADGDGPGEDVEEGEESGSGTDGGDDEASRARSDAHVPWGWY